MTSVTASMSSPSKLLASRNSPNRNAADHIRFLRKGREPTRLPLVLLACRCPPGSSQSEHTANTHEPVLRISGGRCGRVGPSAARTGSANLSDVHESLVLRVRALAACAVLHYPQTAPVPALDSHMARVRMT